MTPRSLLAPSAIAFTVLAALAGCGDDAGIAAPERATQSAVAPAATDTPAASAASLRAPSVRTELARDELRRAREPSREPTRAAADVRGSHGEHGSGGVRAESASGGARGESASGSVRVSRLVLATDVVDRAPVGAATAFRAADTERLYAFLELRTTPRATPSSSSSSVAPARRIATSAAACSSACRPRSAAGAPGPSRAMRRRQAAGGHRAHARRCRARARAVRRRVRSDAHGAVGLHSRRAARIVVVTAVPARIAVVAAACLACMACDDGASRRPARRFIAVGAPETNDETLVVDALSAPEARTRLLSAFDALPGAPTSSGVPLVNRRRAPRARAGRRRADDDAHLRAHGRR